MKLLIMSDIHCHWSRFRPADMPEPDDIDAVIVAGDITNMGKPKGYRSGVSEDWEAAKRWMGILRASYDKQMIYWVPGNHDINVGQDDLHGFCLVSWEGVSILDGFCLTRPSWEPPAHNHQNFYSIVGSALSTAFDFPRLAETWAHTTAHRGEDLQHWQKVPAADIVVSHCPPLGVLDGAGRLIEQEEQEDGSMKMIYGDERRIGSPGLLEYIHRHRPRLVVCGHVHNESKGGPNKDGRQMVGETLVVNTAERWQVVEV